MISNPVRMNITYNEWIFEETLEPPRITILPVYDRSGRTVMYNIHKINLSFKVFDSDGAGASTNDFIEDVRKLLSQPAGHLVIEGIGYDDLEVNRPSLGIGQGTRDCIWGPKPRVISCRQVADHGCWHIDWECEVAIPDRCPEDSNNPRKFLEWSYRVSYAVDQDGLTTRTVSGTVAIPNTRRTVDDRVVKQTIDQHRETVMDAQRIPNFRRIPGQWNITDDKSRADYSFQDVQMTTSFAPPPGCIEIKAHHTLRSTPSSWARFISTINAEIRMGRGYAKASAFRYFIQLVESRKALVRAGNAVLIPIDVNIVEDIYSMSTNFSMSHSQTTKLNIGGNVNLLSKWLRDVLFDSGLWRDPPNGNWDEWERSMKGIDGPRGIARLVLPEDRIIDICDPGGNRVFKFGPLPKPDRILKTVPLDFGRNLRTIPPKDLSWNKYELRTSVLEHDLTTRLNILPFGAGVVHNPRAIKVDSDQGYRPEYDAPRQSPYIYQFRAHPNIRVMFEGEALRAAYMIDRPVFTEFAGVKLIPMNDDSCFFQTSVIADTLIPWCAMRFRLIYGLENIPTKPAVVPPSPQHGGVIGTSARSLVGTFAIK